MPVSRQNLPVSMLSLKTDYSVFYQIIATGCMQRRLVADDHVTRKQTATVVLHHVSMTVTSCVTSSRRLSCWQRRHWFRLYATWWAGLVQASVWRSTVNLLQQNNITNCLLKNTKTWHLGKFRRSCSILKACILAVILPAILHFIYSWFRFLARVSFFLRMRSRRAFRGSWSEDNRLCCLLSSSQLASSSCRPSRKWWLDRWQCLRRCRTPRFITV